MWPDWTHALAGVLVDEPLARHSQYGIGGRADRFVKLDDATALPEIVARCNADSVPLTVLGAGSNALILDGGIRGLVVKLGGRHVTVDDGVVTLDAGTMMPRAALDLARRGLTGMEWGIGVPGTCGASVFGNAGAFGADVAGTLVACEVCHGDGTTRWVETADCGFAYRDSRFKREAAGAVILRGRFAVHADDPVVVKARTDAVQAERKATQPYGVRSLGSTFKNPPDDFAGRLIEAAGLAGHRLGGAQISPKHTNFILNIDHATAADVLGLVDRARDEVASRFDVVLEREIVLLGEPAAAAVTAQSAP